MILHVAACFVDNVGFFKCFPLQRNCILTSICFRFIPKFKFYLKKRNEKNNEQKNSKKENNKTIKKLHMKF